MKLEKNLYKISIMLTLLQFIPILGYLLFYAKEFIILFFFPVYVGLAFIFNEYLITSILMKGHKQTDNNRNGEKLVSNFLTIILPVKNEPLNIIIETIDNFKKINDYSGSKMKIIISDNSDYAIFNQQSRYIQENYGDLLICYIHNRYDYVCNGKSANLNKSLQYVDTQYFLIADADSRFPANIISLITPLLSHNLGILQLRRVDSFIDIKRNFTQNLRHLFKDIIYEKYIAPIRYENGFANFVGHNAIVRTSIAKKINGFNEDILIEDSDFAIRVALEGYDILYSDIETEDGTIDGFSNWQGRNTRLVFGKTQLFFRILFKYRAMPLYRYCGIFFHFGRFTIYYLGIISLILITNFPDNSELNEKLLFFLLIALYPGPLIPSSNIIFFIFYFFQNFKIKILFRYIIYSLILFFINFYNIIYWIHYFLGKKYVFISTKRI